MQKPIFKTMELTGQCKKDFEKWFCRNVDLPDIAVKTMEKVIKDTMLRFYIVSESMQYGVYVDFFDSVGFSIQIETRVFDRQHPVFIHVYGEKNSHTLIGCNRGKTRLEARTKAITKANELYNER